MAMKLHEALNGLSVDDYAFTPEPYYSRAGDCVIFHFEDEESYGDRVDGILTVYRSFEDNRVVGFQMKGILTLVDKFGEFGIEFEEGRFKLSLLVLLSHFEGASGSYREDREKIYSDVAKRSKPHEIDERELVPA